MPCALVVNSGLNIRSMALGSTPFPVSSTDTITLPESWTSDLKESTRSPILSGHGIDRVRDQIHQHLLQLHLVIPTLADPDSSCRRPTGTSIAKTYGGPMRYWLRRDRSHAPNYNVTVCPPRRWLTNPRPRAVVLKGPDTCALDAHTVTRNLFMLTLPFLIIGGTAKSSGLIHSGDSQIVRSSSCSLHESRNYREGHAGGWLSA